MYRVISRDLIRNQTTIQVGYERVVCSDAVLRDGGLRVLVETIEAEQREAQRMDDRYDDYYEW